MEFLTADSGDVSIEIKRSTFLGKLKKVESEEEAKNFVASVKKEHSLATHNCYAYIVFDDGVERVRYSDDGEPQGTAGLPILGVLKNKGLFNVAVVVTRYFGGIKLGAGGLVRAYAETASEACNSAIITKCVLCTKYLVSFSYENYKKFNMFKMPKYSKTLSTEYSDKVNVTFAVRKEDAEAFVGSFESFYNKKQSISALTDIICEFEEG